MVTACLGNLGSSTIGTRHCTFGFSIHLDYKILFMEKNFFSLEDCKKHREEFSAQKYKKFWEDRIMKLPENGRR